MSRKKILFEINHVAHINLFSRIINHYYAKNDYDVYIIGLNRKNLPLIIEKEFKYFPKSSIYNVGIWKPNKFSIIFQANVFRLFQLFLLFLKLKPQIGISSGSLPFSLPLKLLGIPVLEFCDDPDRKIQLKLELFGATRKFYPFFVTIKNSKIGTFNSLKQWSYLSPKTFLPDSKILDYYGLKPREFFFVREVSTASLNYSNQKQGIISEFANKLDSKFQVILSLENKEDRHLYPKDWILLKEPVSDIHSLIYFSKILISSGDSMAREGAILGVPSIYCGDREMGANSVLIEEGMLFKVLPQLVPSFIIELLSGQREVIMQETFRSHLENKWSDLNSFMITQINIHLKNRIL